MRDLPGLGVWVVASREDDVCVTASDRRFEAGGVVQDLVVERQALRKEGIAGIREEVRKGMRDSLTKVSKRPRVGEVLIDMRGFSLGDDWVMWVLGSGDLLEPAAAMRRQAQLQWGPRQMWHLTDDPIVCTAVLAKTFLRLSIYLPPAPTVAAPFCNSRW